MVQEVANAIYTPSRTSRHDNHSATAVVAAWPDKYDVHVKRGGEKGVRPAAVREGVWGTYFAEWTRRKTALLGTGGRFGRPASDDETVGCCIGLAIGSHDFSGSRGLWGMQLDSRGTARGGLVSPSKPTYRSACYQV